MNDLVPHSRVSHDRQAKVNTLRGLASLASAPDKLRVMANHLALLGNDPDAQMLFVLADRIDKAFDEAYVPELAI
jgi:hypothetical protein